MAKTIENKTRIENSATILGHIQISSSATCKDRVYAYNIGVLAVKTIMEVKFNKLIVYRDGDFKDIDIETGLSMKKTIEPLFMDTVTETQSK